MRKRDDWKENIKRVVNLVVGEDKNVKMVCITAMDENNIQKEIVNIFKETLENRNKKVEIIDLTEGRYIEGREIDNLEKNILNLKEKYDYVLINDTCIEKDSLAVAVASLCDETILLIEKGKVNGNRALELKRELDMNNAHVLGCIFIK